MYIAQPDFIFLTIILYSYYIYNDKFPYKNIKELFGDPKLGRNQSQRDLNDFEFEKKTIFIK